MDASSLEELVFDPAKCSKLSVEQKRQLVYEVSKWSDSAVDILHAWSRQEILQVLCFELGKERKYTGFTKSKIIELLLKIIQDKESQKARMSVESCERTPKRQRKSDHFSAASNGDPITAAHNVEDSVAAVYCKNFACKAKIIPQDMFCKRCSCCICHKYDDNKDPSLWLTCNADPPFHGRPCGMSCHLECALRHENSGISKDMQDKGLDGSFCCVSCGKVNDLLGSWRKQIVEARDTRRVDILCYRLSLSQKILAGTKHYLSLSEIVDEAVRKLEEEVGPLTGLPVKMARGIVNRLSSGPEIQRMCASAVKSLDLMLLGRVSEIPSDRNQLVEIGSFEYKLATQSSPDNDNNSKKLEETERSESPAATNCSTLSSNPSSVEDETHNNVSLPMMIKETIEELIYLPNDAANLANKESSNGQMVEETSTDDNNGSNALPPVPCVDSSQAADLLITPPRKKVVDLKSVFRKGNRHKKGIDDAALEGGEQEPHICSSSKDEDFDRCVKAMRRLECGGHIETAFREKFLTWYGLRATAREIRIVKVFMETFSEDMESLADQLVDTFYDVVSNKRSCTVPSGFCTKLWH